MAEEEEAWKTATAKDHREIMVSKTMQEILEAQVDMMWDLEMPLLAEFLARKHEGAHVAEGAGAKDAPHAAEASASAGESARTSGGPRVLDVGCGTGLFLIRLAAAFPSLQGVGLDLEASMVEYATRLAGETGVGDRVRFVVGRAERMSVFADASFDLVINRHAIHMLTRAARSACLGEMVRVLRPGGRLHVVAEDYSMIEFSSKNEEDERVVDAFWSAALLFGRNADGDWTVGHRLLAQLRHSPGAALVDWDPSSPSCAREHLVTWDSWLRQDKMKRVWDSWRAGYTTIVADTTGVITVEDCRRAWTAMCGVVDEGPVAGRLVWRVPIIQATRL
jgi:SAM-dependent methyltransferase